ncbi:hypothetical protein BH20ACI3_BH20ACI3_27940 [soil metagenome]
MSETRKRLTELRRHEQEVRNYSSSSRWYTGTGLAIKYIELAETATSPAEVFRNAWYAIYNLYMMTHKRGEAENIALSSWIEEAQASQKVRAIALATSTDFFEALMKAQNSLLFDAESKKPRDAKQLTELWLFKRKQGKELSPEKACSYLLLIGRDLRNAISHPKQDPNSPTIKKALKLAAESFLPLAIAATDAMIEHPPEGTTGRATAYRSFLYPFLKNSDTPFSDYYLEKLFPDQELDAFPEAEAKTSLKEIAKELDARRGELVRADAEETTSRWCVPVLFKALGLIDLAESKIIADDGVFEPTRVIKKADLQGPTRKEYKAKDAGRDLSGLVWVLPWRVSLDAISRDAQFEELTVMEVIQRALTRADVDWAIMTNGQQVRLLSKITAHKPRSFLELDLITTFERRNERDAQLAFRYLLGICSQSSLTEKDAEGRTCLDRAVRESERHGKAISKELKENIFTALQELGVGFLEYMHSKPDEFEAWRLKRAPSASNFASSQELMTDIYQESLSLMYRLLFLFYAESRDLLPMDQDLYRDSYSLESIRDDIISTHDDPDPKRFFSPGATDLWRRLKELFEMVNGSSPDIVPAYNGGLFDPEQHEFLEKFKVNDNRLARAIDLLSRTRPGTAKGEGRKKVTYRDLEIRHLGSIYEGILEYHADIAEQAKAIVKRGSAGRVPEDYVNLTDLTADERKHLKAYREAVAEDEENPLPPKGCKVTGLIEAGEYYLIFGGRESKRKSSGSYYTPDYIVQYIVENTLGPLVRGECRPRPEPIPELVKGKPGFEEETDEVRPLTPGEILDLKVLDPAMGSAHFLVAATEYLARAYGSACIREGKDKDGVMSDVEFVHYKRRIAERCIYGVDINPMAVELAKLSMWLFTMDKGRPLSFLNHHLKTGNALIGGWIKNLGQPPEFDAKGKLKKRQRKDTLTQNLFDVRFRERVPKMVNDLFEIMEKETLSIEDVRDKKALDQIVEEIKLPFKNTADIWVALWFGEVADDYNSLLVSVEQARHRKSLWAHGGKPFHWELEFPEAFFDRSGEARSKKGFDAVIGNPPWGGQYKSLTSTWLMSAFAQFHQRTPETGNYFLAAVCQDLLCAGGAAGLILPSVIFYQNEFAQSRRIVLRGYSIKSFVNLGDGVFENVTAPCGILILANQMASETYPAADLRDKPRDELPEQLTSIQKQEDIKVKDVLALQDAPFVCDNKGLAFALTTQRNGVALKHLVEDVASGISTGGDDAFRVPREYARATFGNNDLLKPVIKGEDITEFFVPDDSGHVIIYSTKETDVSRFPEMLQHLHKFQQKLARKRETVQGKLPWFCIHWPRYPALFGSPKVVLRQTSDTLVAAVDIHGYFTLDSLNVLKVEGSENALEECYYLTGLLNSEPIRRLYQFLTQEEERIFPQVKPSNIKKLSLPNLDQGARRTIIETAKRLQEIQVDRVKILRGNQASSMSVHQGLLALKAGDGNKLSTLTAEYQRLKFRIDELVIRGLDLSISG